MEAIYLSLIHIFTGITVSSIKRTSLQYTCFGTRVSLNELALGETAGGIIQYYELCLYDKTDPANYIRILFERDNLISDTELLKYCDCLLYTSRGGNPEESRLHGFVA